MKKMPTQQRAQTTVEAVLDAAAQVICELGFEAGTTNHIAERAGVSIGSLYEYFPGKLAVYAELRRREAHNWYTRLIAFPRPTAPDAVIRHLITSRIQWVLANPQLYLALEAPALRSATQAEEAAIYQDFFKLSVAYFRANSQRIRDDVAPEFLAEFLMRVVSATIHDYASASLETLQTDALREQLISLIERYAITPVAG